MTIHYYSEKDNNDDFIVILNKITMTIYCYPEYDNNDDLLLFWIR